ncbi:MAG: 2-hydroxychromene-2-carboxylate isomerase [Desulfocapsaceae bacterium]|nr:2-hydroxychromene-2-carboxylate isomerase [Desulfocapsaceae bacterium]
MKNQSLEFWYEFASTYSYLSAMRIENLASRYQFEIAWKPFMLGPIFKEQGWHDSPFNIYPAKGRYMWTDLARQSRKRELSFRKPSVFPRNGLLAARIAILGSKEPWISAFTQKVFQANFEKDEDISDVEKIKLILNSLDLDSDKIIALSQEGENKELLKAQTERAKQLGIFGAPSFIVKDELFWGDDRLEDAIELLTDLKKSL